MKGLRILTLRAVRLARRAPMRSLTTGLLVTLAVLVATIVLAESHGHHVTNSRSWLGDRADVSYTTSLVSPDTTMPGTTIPGTEQVAGVDEVVERVLTALPVGSDMAVVTQFSAFNRVSSGLLDLQQAAWSDSLLEGSVRLTDGRLPGPGEVVISPSLAVEAGVDVGDRLLLTDPFASLKVVGIGATDGRGDFPSAIVAPGEFEVDDDAAAQASLDLAATVVADLPPGATAPEIRLDDGTRVLRTIKGDNEWFSYSGSTPPTGASTATLLLMLLFVGLTAGATFGIGAARRRRALGLLATNGATAGQLRTAAGTEALVISVPAVAVGVTAALLVPPVWVRLRLPGWSWVWPSVAPLPWVVLLAVAAVVAAVLGTLVFSGSTLRAPVVALLDGRRSARPGPMHPTRVRGRRVGLTFAGLALVAVPLLWMVIATWPIQSPMAVLGLLAMLLGWCLLGAAVGAVVLWAPGRHAIGRLVGRNLRRRPMGTAAAVAIITVWSFGAALTLLTAGLEGNDADAASTDTVQPAAVEQVDTAGTVTIQPPPVSGIRHRSVDPTTRPGAPPDDLRDELSELGLETQPGTVGTFTGPCGACPQGVQPSVLVLDSLDGLDLPAATAAALRSGSAVTAIELPGLDGSVIGDLRVTVAPLPFDTSAAILRDFAPDGTALADPVGVLVGSAKGLSDEGAADVLTAASGYGLAVFSQDPRLRTFPDSGPIEPDAGSSARDIWRWLASIAVLVLVAVIATAAHRREHGETAEVLTVLGAAPGASRRLATLTGGTIALVGVLTGSLPAAIISAVGWANDTDLGFQSLRMLAVTAMVVVVPAVAALLGGLLPPARSGRRQLQPA